MVAEQALLRPPRYGARLQFYPEKSVSLSSLVDSSRRIVLTHTIYQALSAAGVSRK